jgi:hypothetical protein
LTAATRELLEARRRELHVRDPEMTAFMLVHVIDALTEAAILERPEYLSEPAYVEAIAGIALGLLGVTA